jgi:hypothetical protein
MVTRCGAIQRTFDRRSFRGIRQRDKNIIGDKSRPFTLARTHFGTNDDLSIASSGRLRSRHQVARYGAKIRSAGRFPLTTSGKKRNRQEQSDDA